MKKFIFTAAILVASLTAYASGNSNGNNSNNSNTNSSSASVNVGNVSGGSATGGSSTASSNSSAYGGTGVGVGTGGSSSVKIGDVSGGTGYGGAGGQGGTGYGGAGGQGGQGGKGGNATGGVAISGGNTQNITITNPDHVEYSGTQTIKNVPSVNGPELTSSNDTCMGSTSGSVNIAGLGIGGGSTWVDPNCKMLKNSRELWNMGMKAAAMALMCSDAANREALTSTGYECPPLKAEPVRKTIVGNENRSK